MHSVLSISDTILDLVVKEVSDLSTNQISINAIYSEDITLKLISLTEEEIGNNEVIFIHSDQLFHQRDEEWHKAYYNAVKDLSKKWNKVILLSNTFSKGYAATPLKSLPGYYQDLSNLYQKDYAEILRSSNVFIIDLFAEIMQIGLANFYNYNSGHLYQMPYTAKGIKAIAQQLVNQVKFLFSEEKKAIILDCDNTLWKGIVGEDGVDGIVCDKNSQGTLYYSFQSFLKVKQEEGFLLCLCSKNNESDVKEAFDKNNFPLKWSDFIVKKINWTDKVTNINSIAKELNISTDSFIFIDDNLFELNLVKEFIPGIECVQLTGNYNDFLHLIRQFVFRRKQILLADKEKSKQYETEQVREKEKLNFTNPDEFIKSLNIELDIRLNDVSDLERLAQLTEKTNQFNFNKHTYSADELKEFIEGKGRIYSLKVSDKYGSYGTVGLMLISFDGKESVMENYLLSCRVLGKGIEKLFYDDVLQKLSKEKTNLKKILFVESEKNIPARDFLKKLNLGHIVGTSKASAKN